MIRLSRFLNLLLVVALLVGLGDQVGVWRTASVRDVAAAAAPHSLALNGTTAAAEVAASPILNLAGDWTIELWLKDEDPRGFDHDYVTLLNKGDRAISGESPYVV